MNRQLLAACLVAALAAVPVRADDSLIYLAGRPSESQMGSDLMRDRLKDFLSRQTVSAPIRRAPDVSTEVSLSGANRPETQDLAPEESVAEPEVQVAALTGDPFAAPIASGAPAAVVTPESDPVLSVPEEVVLPPETVVAALTVDHFAMPISPGTDSAALEPLVEPAASMLAPEEIVLPPTVMLAALPAYGTDAPVAMQAETAALKPLAELELALPGAERAIDGTQVAHFSDGGRKVVFDSRDDAVATLDLQPPTPPMAQLDRAYDHPNSGKRQNPVGARPEPVQVAAAGPVPLVPDNAEAASDGQASETALQPRWQPRPLPKPQRTFTQLAALSTEPAPSSQVISIDGQGKPLTIQTGKGRMLRLPEAVDAVFVAQPDIADIQMKSPRLLYLFGRQPGETTIYATTKDETVVLNQRIQVAHNLEPLNELIQAIHPESVIEVRSLNNTVVLTGLVPDVATAENIFQLAGQVLGENGRVMNRIKVAGINQVNLRVRIAEVRREISKELGFNWDVLRTTGSLAIGFATAGFGSITSATTNVLTTEATLGSLDVNSVIYALDDEGLISVLAEPNLTAMNGEIANFLAGGEFPIPIAQGDDTISITFKQFGVSLSFSPQVLEKGRINVKVLTEVSQLSQAGAVQVSDFSVPALTTRRAETTVELRSGQSFAIAGLLQNTINQTIEEFPGLADLPILGPLFKSEQFQRDETELLVVVTPYLVRPTNAQIALPMDGYVPPTDSDRFLRQTNRPRVPNANTAPRDRGGRPGSVGEAGFIVR